MPDDHPHADSATGTTRTGQVLAATRNRAVLPILLAGLQSSHPKVRAATIRAAVRRHDTATHTQLIRHFGGLSETDQSILCAAHGAMPHHAAPALCAAILEGDATACLNACRIVLLSDDVELFAALLAAAENRKHRHRTEAASTVVQLVERLRQDLVRWAAGNRTGHHDPSFKRHHVLAALEQSMSRYAHHRCQEIIDAFLLLAPIDNRTLNRILHDPQHPCQVPVINELTSTQDSGIVERLFEVLRDTDAPTAVLDVVASRSDQQFVDILLNGITYPVPLRILHNFRRISHVAWLEEHHELLLELGGRAQAVAVELAVASNVNRDRVFDLLAFLLKNALAEGRRASCQALAKFNRHDADELVLNALADPDAGVQAAAVRQLRPRRLADALQRLVALLDSCSPEVRDAARSSLAEFNFTRYRTMFDLLDEQAAHTTGMLVHKVDPSARPKLVEELSSPSITSKLRGIEMAVAMGATDDVRQQLIELVHYENVAVRKEAVAALAHCNSREVVASLELAANDANASIAEAAQRSLAQLQLGAAPPINSMPILGGAP